MDIRQAISFKCTPEDFVSTLKSQTPLASTIIAVFKYVWTEEVCGT